MTQTDFQPTDDVEIELEPTIAAWPAADDDADASGARAVDRSAHVGLVAGSQPSLTGETASLRRSRLTAVTLFLTAAYGLAFAWVLSAKSGEEWWFPLLAGGRTLFVGALAVLLLSRAALSPRALRAIEYSLFGVLTLLLCLSQYWADLAFIQAGEAAKVVAHEKNGVIHLVILMVLYGMFLPNNAWTTAKVVLTMALASIATLAVLLERPDAAETLQHMRSIEQAGSNALLVIVGAGLAIYGAYLINGLRVELHEAKRFGQYQLRQKIGSGGMGDVYMAEHQLLKRPCALKLIQGDMQTNWVALSRFEREVQSAARLSHPNVIEIYDYGHTNDGTFYYVMEFLPGMGLDELVRRFGPIPPGRAIYLVRQACGGLAEAH